MNAQRTSSFLKENTTAILLGIIVVLSLILLYFIVLGNKKISQILPNFTPTPTPRAYSTLDKTSNTIVNSEKPKEAAKQDHIAVTNEGMKAVITLKDESFLFTEEYGTQVLRYGKFIQAIIKFDKLEELAKNPKIESIRATADSSNLPPGVNISTFKKK